MLAGTRVSTAFEELFYTKKEHSMSGNATSGAAAWESAVPSPSIGENVSAMSCPGMLAVKSAGLASLFDTISEMWCTLLAECLLYCFSIFWDNMAVHVMHANVA